MSSGFQSTQTTDKFSVIVPVTEENLLAVVQKFEVIYLVTVKTEQVPSVYVSKFRIRETFMKTTLFGSPCFLQQTVLIQIALLFSRHYKQHREFESNEESVNKAISVL